MLKIFRKVKPMDIIFFGGLGGLMCTLIVIYGTWLHNKQSSAKSTQIKEGVEKANEQVGLLQEQNEALRNKVDELRVENSDLYTKLAASNKEIYNNITGGDSNSPILVMFLSNLLTDSTNSIPDHYTIEFWIENHGQYPLKNIRLQIVDFFGSEMTEYGVKHWIKGDAYGYGATSQNEEFDHNPIFTFPSIFSGKMNRFYITTSSLTQASSSRGIFYNVYISWDNGYLLHSIELKSKNKLLELVSIKTSLNGKDIEPKNHFGIGRHSN